MPGDKALRDKTMSNGLTLTVIGFIVTSAVVFALPNLGPKDPSEWGQPIIWLSIGTVVGLTLFSIGVFKCFKAHRMDLDD